MSRAPRIPNAQWEKHKHTIRNLYISQEKKLEDVIKLMAGEHGFQPTKAQYVRKLESWGFKKNSSKEKWEHAAAVVRKRKSEGKETELQMNGKVISTKRLRKEFGRYANLPSFSAAPPTDPDHDLEGVVARTPPCSLSSGFIMPNYLPWFQFQDYLASIIIPRSSPVSNPGWPVSQRTPSQSLTLPEQTWTGILEAKGSYSQFSEWLSRHSVTIPERPGDETHVQLQHLSQAQPFLQVIQRVIYLSSNNLLSDKQTDNFQQWVTGSGNIWALKEIINRKESTCQAFACQLLLSAIRLGNEELVSAILTRDARPENDNALPEDAIQTAVYSGNSGIVQLLLDHLSAANTSDSSRQVGQYLNSKNTGRYDQFEDAFPLSSAIRHGDMTMVMSLLDAGADVDNMADVPISALHVAVEEERLEMIEILLQAGADVNIPLGEGDREFYQISHAYGVPKSPLQVAAEDGMDEIVQELLEEGADIDGAWFTSIEMSGNQDLVQLFIEEGGHVNAKPTAFFGVTCLQAAASSGNENVVRMFLEYGAEPNAPASYRGEMALPAAVSRGHVGVTEMLLKAGAFVNQIEGELTPLCLAISRQSHELFELLMRGVDINAPIFHPRTVLQHAVEQGHIDIVQELISRGADVNAPGCPRGGRTALQLAVEGGHIHIARKLISCGADVNAPPASKAGATALQFAAMNGNIEMAVLLLENQADVNAGRAPCYGRTALEGAAEHGRLDMVYFLLQNDQDLDTIEERCQGAAKFAEEEEHFEIARILREWRRS
ncbi:hypothetical protein CEP53_000938 [Fusarium sp. AF-6]|nr:hypothetical protein CEP53_000938 [Fusarium sp. AF-6]